MKTVQNSCYKNFHKNKKKTNFRKKVINKEYFGPRVFFYFDIHGDIYYLKIDFHYF